MEPLRKCKCGLRAFNKEDLKFFVISKLSKHGYCNKCKQCKKLNSKNHYTNNKDYHKNYKANIVEQTKVYQKDYQKRNKESLKTQSSVYYQNNKVRLQKINKIYYLNNKDKSNACNAKRRAQKLLQTPILTGKEQQQITNIYKLSNDLAKALNTKMHVDHIIPLSKGGLHHPSNLKIITAEENMEKGSIILKDLPRFLIKLHSDYYGTTDDWAKA